MPDRRLSYFDQVALKSNLKQKTVRGGVVTTASQAVGIALTFLSVPVLSYLLDPADFGLIQMVAFFTGLAAMFADAGLSMATVQRDNVTHHQVSNLFWIASLLGATIMLVVAAAAPAISWFYVEPRLTAITLALSVSHVVSGLGIQHKALLYRGLQMGRVAVVNITSRVAGLTAAVAWAWWRRGQPDDYWALVLMPLATGLTNTLMMWALCPWRPGAPRRGAGTRSMVQFGANLTGTAFVNYFARNTDNLLIGKVWGEGPLGLYAQAYKLLLWPLQQVLAPMSAVATPALSRLRDEPAAYRSYFRTGVMLAAMVLTPLVFVSLVLADDLFKLLGPKWEGATPIFLALGPAALMAVTAPATHWVYVSWGHTRLQLQLTTINSVCVILGFLAAVAFGPFWVAVSFSVVVCALRVPNVVLAFRPTPLRLPDLFGPMIAPFVAATAAAAAAVALDLLLRLPDGDVLSLVLVGAVFGAVYLAALFAIPDGREGLKRSFKLVGSALPGAPAAN